MIKKRLMGMLSHAKKYIVYQVAWQWLALLCHVILVFSLSMLLEQALSGGADRRQAVYCGVTALLAAGLRFPCDRLSVRASCRAGMDVKRILRSRIYQKMLRLGPSYREKVTTSEVVQLAAEGVEQLETYFGKYLSQLIYSLLAPATLFAILSFQNWKAALVLLACVPLIPLVIMAVQKIAGKLLGRYWGIYTDLGDSFLENLQGMTTLKIYQADGMKAEEMDRESRRFRKITMKVLTMQLNSTVVMDVVACGGAAAGIIMTLVQLAGGNVSIHGALMLVLLAPEFFIPMRALGSLFHVAMNGMAASDRIFDLLDLPEPEEKEETLDGEELAVRFSGVHFSYGDGREALKGADMEFPAGSLTSIVGVSGCGKSTAAAVLTGRNRNYLGSVTAGGKEISRIREDSLLEHITLVDHNSYLFRGTVEDNLRMGKPDATEKEMQSALEAVNLWDFLESRQGLRTPVHERGANFSGGQRQRLAIARALLHDTPVYVFDEAASSIDAESGEMIMDVVRALARTRTVILISHRLADVTESGRIYLMEDGRVAESGSHGELMARNGRYAGMYRAQMELERPGKEGMA